MNINVVEKPEPVPRSTEIYSEPHLQRPFIAVYGLKHVNLLYYSVVMIFGVLKSSLINIKLEVVSC